MARYVFEWKCAGEIRLYAESTVDEDKLDRQSEGNGYLAFWQRCMGMVQDLRNTMGTAYSRHEWHGEIEDLNAGEIVKSW